MIFVLAVDLFELNRRTPATLAATLDARGFQAFKEPSDVRSRFRLFASWIVENVKATMHGDKDTAEHLAQDCVWEARTRGITKANLIEAAGRDLDAYILAELIRAVDRDVESRVPQGVS
jgi:hypothetical protein